MAAAERGAGFKSIPGGQLVDFRPEDLRGSLRRGMESNLIVFVVDASGSMAARDRLSAVSGAVVSMLQDAYRRRDKVAVVSVRGAQPEVLLPPTGSVEVAVKRMEGAPTGGRTPLAEGLVMAQDLIECQARKEPSRRAIMVVLSDGRATGAAGIKGVRLAAAAIARRGLSANVVIDCERGRVQLGLAKELAQGLGAAWVQLDELNADTVASIIGI